VPTLDLAMADIVLRILEVPKSEILRTSSSVTKMFSGLRSLWRIFL
jgi:hypothetical protein